MLISRRTSTLRVMAVAILAAGFAIYSEYGRLFYAGFLADCRDIAGADLKDADDGRLTVGMLYAFLIAAIPPVLVSREALWFILAAFALFDIRSSFS